MIRYLPIVMVALGLLLVSTSFAAAQSDVGQPADPAAVCLDLAAHADSDGHEPGRCWKEIGLGILIAGCTVHAELPREDFTLAPRPAPCWPPLADPVPLDDPAPPLDIPPPRA